ncbi:hypothetical protein A8E81_22055 [Burkholderia cenocepacia]|nr:hypothetical protein A8E75_11455 [Burkholderia cenocepacia]ONV49743.1 hypothetical protein A8E81_22055 [Burkholderia cenocepacia]
MRDAIRTIDRRTTANCNTRRGGRHDGRLPADRDTVRRGGLRALRRVAADCDRAGARSDGRVRI